MTRLAFYIIAGLDMGIAATLAIAVVRGKLTRVGAVGALLVIFALLSSMVFMVKP